MTSGVIGPDIIVKRYNNPLALFFNALFWGFAYGFMPFFVFIYTGLIKDGFLYGLILVISAMIAVIVTIYKFMSFRVNKIVVTATKIEYTYLSSSSWTTVVDSIKLEDITSIYIMPNRGVRLAVKGKSALDMFVTIPYTLMQLSPIKERLQQLDSTNNANYKFTDDTAVNGRHLLKVILISASAVILILFVALWLLSIGVLT